MQEILGDLYPAYSDLKWWRQSVVKSYIKLADGLNFDTGMLLITDSELNMLAQVWSIFIPLACGVMLLFFLLGILKDAQRQFRELDAKFVYIQIFKLCLAQLFIYFGPTIIVSILNLGNYYMNYCDQNPIVAAATNTASQNGMHDYYAKLIEAVKECGFFSCIMFKTQTLLIDILSLAPAAALMLQAISRRVEIVLRGGFSCVALCDLFSDDRRPAAITYMKKFAVVVFHGFMMILVIQICRAASMESITNSLLNAEVDFDDLGNVIPICLYQFAAVGLIGAAKQILSDALNAN